MLRTLTIRDFVIVDYFELEFSTGFSVLTGETGAGKSILIDALSLALGGRADQNMVREGAMKADICAEFCSHQTCDVWLAKQEIDIEENMILLRRTIDNAGRSKAYINGVSVTASQLRELGAMLVDIHGQHAHQSLLHIDAHRQIVDNYAQLTTQVQEVSELYKAWHALVQQRKQFEINAKQVLLDRERLEWQVNELNKLAVKPGEWQEMTSEHSRLAHAASLIEGAQYALNAISESDNPVLSQIAAAHQKLAKLVEFDEKLDPILDTLESARIHLQEVTSTLNEYLSRVELDPGKLRQVEERVETLHACARKFHVSPEQLPHLLDTLSAELIELGEASDLASLIQLEQLALKEYQRSAAQLAKQRAIAADKLSNAVTVAMQELSMAGGCFKVAITPIEPSLFGTERIEFMVAGHAGVAARPLNKVASGGELARIALAISVIASSATATPTLIFDEVDSGIGGAVAEVVGQLLKRLGQRYQVLCVTHLAQVASQADHHFLVSKLSRTAGTISQIDQLDHASRVEEIARMMGGLEITATIRQHAKELLTN